MNRSYVLLSTLALLAACSGKAGMSSPGAGGVGATGGSGATGGTGTGGTGGGGGGGGNTPVIASFDATPATLPAGGGMVTLSWSVTGADSLSIDQGVGPVTGTSVMANVTATTIFTLSATNKDGTSTRSALVMVGAGANDPVIVSFTATPATLPTGGGQAMLTWQVVGADSLTIDQGVGTVTGSSKSVSVTATTIFTLTATNSSGSSKATTAVVIGNNPASMTGGRAVDLLSPTGGETFISPATLRLVASGRDPNIDTNQPSDGLGGNASKVQFFVDDSVVLEVDGANAEYWVFKGFTSTGIPSGQHRVWARAIYVNPSLVLDSVPTLITVADPPTYAMTMDLSGDVTVGSSGFSLVGSANGRIRLNGNGHRILSSSGSGAVTLKFVDAFDLGSRTDGGQAAVDVTTSGNLTIEDSTFDTSNTMRFTQTGSSTASVRRNLWRSNMRMTLGQNPDSGNSQPSYPCLHFSGSATGAKVFAGNNVGAGWVGFDGVQNWTVGGDTDADSNVVIGPRCGIFVQNSMNTQVRRNFSHHSYKGGWSQGNNMELDGSPSLTVEHNIIYGGSWPVRAIRCEFRYNLVANSGHEWIWVTGNNASVHHNIFAGGQSDIGGVYVLYSPTGLKINNNTFDGQLHPDMVTAIKLQQGTIASLSSNAFINVKNPPTVSIEGGTLTSADYNAFGNPQTTNYSDGRKPAHDLSNGAKIDPMLTSPPSVPFDLALDPIWMRSTTVKDILMIYRMRYTPKAGSPLIDAGDPALTSGNDIGAVGAGQTAADDKFGLF